jgi:arabinose-5-phosphate isomerase
MLRRAREVLSTEANAIKHLITHLDKRFEKAVEIIYACKGRVVVTGMGKPGIIGQKLSATLASTGTPSLSLHPAEAIHGDLGRVTKEDVIIALSNSGETEEILRLLPTIKKIGAKFITLTGSPKSTLARNSDVVLDVSVKKEACPLNLAPTASTTAMLAMADALAVCLLEERGFKERDFAFYHPGGSLGKQLLLTVDEIMRKGASHPVVKEDSLVEDVLLAITQARAGSATVTDKNGKLVGIFTDGDLRRHLGSDPYLAKRKVKAVMTKAPKVIKTGRLAAEAMRILESCHIDEIPVVDEKARPVGLVDVQDLLRAGIV